MQTRLTGLTFAALGGAGLFPAAAGAQTIDVTLTLPKLTVAEYHKPYVAIWIEGTPAPKTLAIWYDVGKRNNAGTKWLRDVRTWWQRAGRSQTVPADGISGATRAPGVHKLSFTAGRGGLAALPAGNYTIVVEAARETGGREAVRIPFTWNGSRAVTGSAKGSAELGTVSISIHR